MMWESHLTARRIRDAQFMLDVCKVHPTKVAQRLGITEDALHRLLERGDHGEPDTAGVPCPGGDAGPGPVREMRREG
jgi:hypothetical protein